MDTTRLTVSAGPSTGGLTAKCYTKGFINKIKIYASQRQISHRGMALTVYPRPARERKSKLKQVDWNVTITFFLKPLSTATHVPRLAINGVLNSFSTPGEGLHGNSNRGGGEGYASNASDLCLRLTLATTDDVVILPGNLAG